MSYYSIHYKVDSEAKYKHYWKYFSDVNGPILDIGCATGNFGQWCPEAIVGIDQDFHGLRIAARRNLTVCQAKVNRSLCFASESFAGVNCSAVLEHIHEPRALMREIWRVLLPGGKAVVLVPDIRRYRFGYWQDYTHVTPFTKEGLHRLAVDGGFSDPKIRRYAFNYLRCLPGARRTRMRAHLDRGEAVMAALLSKDLVMVAHKKVDRDS